MHVGVRPCRATEDPTATPGHDTYVQRRMRLLVFLQVGDRLLKGEARSLIERCSLCNRFPHHVPPFAWTAPR